MAASTAEVQQDLSVADDVDPIVIVGAGPVGVRCAEELARRVPQIPVVLYGAESWTPYNRVRLSSLLAGESSLEELSSPPRVAGDARLVAHYHCRIERIDRDNKQVIDARGHRQPYRALILATGSVPHVPSIPGIDLPGVFTFRDMDDAQRLIARRVRSRRVIVLGGGLLGLETARAMGRLNTQITVIEHAGHLMFRQLDPIAGRVLRRHVERLGLEVIVGNGVQAVLGDGQVEGVRLRDGRELACDTLLVATGIRSTIALAREAGLGVNRGVRVDDTLRSSDPDVYAIGECAEHRGQVYGLVAPGLEQAAVLAHNLGGGEARYLGSTVATTLKVAGCPVFSIGEVDPDSEPEGGDFYQDAAGRRYRRLMLERGRLVGAIAVGPWDDVSRVQEAVLNRRRLWPWQRRRFRRTGEIWPAAAALDVARWPATAIVCNCTGVTRGQLTDAIDGGCDSAEQLSASTGASSVCGSCRPLLAGLVGQSGTASAVKGQTALVTAALLAMLGALGFALAPVIPFADTVQVELRWDQLWRDGLLKQVSGFSLLGLGVLISVLSLRKRLRWFRWGDFPLWRVLHALLGGAAVALLIAHTGLRLGENLDRLLMLCFLGTLLLGGAFAAVIAVEHRLGPTLARRLRGTGFWLHLLLVWPLPVLLGIHVLKAYFF